MTRKHLLYAAVTLWAKINPALYLKLTLRSVLMRLRTQSDSHIPQNSCCSHRTGNPICAQEAVKTCLLQIWRLNYATGVSRMILALYICSPFTIHKWDYVPTLVSIDRLIDSCVIAVWGLMEQPQMHIWHYHRLPCVFATGCCGDAGSDSVDGKDALCAGW